MKIDISKIDFGRFVIREEDNKEYLDQLMESLKTDGQWNPIIIRPKDGGRYEVVSGHYRLRAAKMAGLKDIEATIRDLSDEEAMLLSLKTNLLRLEMTAREQGKVLSYMLERFKWSQRELARRLGVSPPWISRRIRVALDLHEDVATALDDNVINFEVASIIGGVEISLQPSLLERIIDRKITQAPDARRIRQQILNDTIYTIGYQGRKITEFIDVLNNNDIRLVIDARYSADSQLEPEYNVNILNNELKRAKIDYEHKPELGLPNIIQNPYKKGEFSFECLEQWYRAHIKEEFDLETFVTHLKNTGKSAIMCTERYAKPAENQEYACHRDILADMILDYEPEDSLLKFMKRLDL